VTSSLNGQSQNIPSLASTGVGIVVVKGPVTFSTAGHLLDAGQAVFGLQPGVTIDLREVTSVDSAGLALLLEWLRQARADRRAVRFVGIPEKLLAIARLSGVEALLTDGYSPAGVVPSGSIVAGSTGSGSSSSDSSR
jgi:phospholipid transport system transporter-binding protein